MCPIGNAMPLVEINGHKLWIPSMTPKGQKVFLKRSRITLLHGPRKTAKSNICQNALIGHCYEHDDAVAGIIVKGVKTAVNGCWGDIIGPRGILQKEWFPNIKKCRYAPGGEPRMESDTKMRYFEITNQHGGRSRIEMHTLPHEKHIDRFKDTRFSFLYLVEVDRWDSQSVLNDLAMQLRIPHIPHQKRCMVLDCNPPRIGKRHWLYKYFIEDKMHRYPPDVDPDLSEVGFTLDDNPFLSPEEKDEIRKRNAHDPVELDRNYYGKWVASSEGTLFQSQYSRALHVIGDTSPTDISQKTILMPPNGCFDFPTGWDMGDAMNHACVIGCKTVSANGAPIIFVIDEIVRTKVNFSAEKFAHLFMQRKDYWTEKMKGRGSPHLKWEFWSDSSSERYSAAADRSVATAVRKASDGFIRLNGVQKKAGSVAGRVDLLQRALYNNQVYVSSLCPHTIQMLEEIEESEPGSGTVDPHHPLKHVFDALTYMLGYTLPTYAPVSRPTESRVISIR